jgi:hypothetical protein
MPRKALTAEFHSPKSKGKKPSKTLGPPLVPPKDLTRFIEQGTLEISEPARNALLEAYYRNRGSLQRACRETGFLFGTVKNWRKTDKRFREALSTLDELINDEIEQLFLDRVFDGTERNPAWSIFRLKSTHEKYIPEKAQKTGQTIQIFISDDTFKRAEPTIIDVKPINEEMKALNEPDQAKPERALEGQTDPS